MQYLSGQCEKQNAEDVCNLTLRTYLMEKGLLHNTDYPTDSARFSALLEEREQKRIQLEQHVLPRLGSLNFRHVVLRISWIQ